MFAQTEEKNRQFCFKTSETLIALKFIQNSLRGFSSFQYKSMKEQSLLIKLFLK